MAQVAPESVHAVARGSLRMRQLRCGMAGIRAREEAEKLALLGAFLDTSTGRELLAQLPNAYKLIENRGPEALLEALEYAAEKIRGADVRPVASPARIRGTRRAARSVQ